MNALRGEGMSVMSAIIVKSLPTTTPFLRPIATPSGAKDLRSRRWFGATIRMAVGGEVEQRRKGAVRPEVHDLKRRVPLGG